MTTLRLISLQLAAACAALAAAGASAAEFPTRAIRVLVGFAPGGSADIIARAVGQKLSESFRHPVVVDNRSGASGIIATELASKAEPDGYTLLEATMTTHGTGPHLYRKLPYDAVNDFAPVAGLARIPLVMFVHASVPANGLNQFIAAAKGAPGKFRYGSAGAGSPPHLVAELLKLKTGVQLLHVPYKGTGAALPDLIAGQIHMMIDGPPPFLPHAKAGKLKALAAASEKRNPLLPHVPTFAEAGMSGMEAGLWYGILAPKRTPKAVIAKLNAAINRALAEADLRERFATLGVETLGGPPEAFARYMAAEHKRWGEVVRAANIKIE
ncbi:MAG TPA: tripartite tricarboxylate transporter substrate binding protein [Burkholderiales bacterium]|nr:tripartite tricarboxylate transporter substrate binding protein [Burkholderiales bacterium]